MDDHFFGLMLGGGGLGDFLAGGFGDFGFFVDTAADGGSF